MTLMDKKIRKVIKEYYDHLEQTEMIDRSDRESFRDSLYELIYLAEKIVGFMPDKGLKCCDSQKICLLNSLREFEFAINGTKREDFIANKEGKYGRI
ncbi:MAG: hypothetical protein U9P79_09470 [Candidatus Cloacimonadota bacterium]|nr:hypothetical protein [Candidatus Cloacimonadota bacterium]